MRWMHIGPSPPARGVVQSMFAAGPDDRHSQRACLLTSSPCIRNSTVARDRGAYDACIQIAHGCTSSACSPYARLCGGLSPSINEIEDTEVVQAAKFVHWAQNDDLHRAVQLGARVALSIQKMAEYAQRDGLDGVDDRLRLVSSPLDALLRIGNQCTTSERQRYASKSKH